ncbi:MAG: hypothetical protein IJJ68_04085 [Prevotella sp.]|nr:hypothetical protein [Prevotella sp.]MBR7048652.1 hypothetical protein [Prevotella sp.]
MKTIYECSQSKGVKRITVLFILAMILGVLTEMYFVSKGRNVTGAIIVSAILLLVAFSCFLIFPSYIISDDEGIGIKTLLRTIRIPYEKIDHIERIDEQKPLFGVTNTIRLFGVGGVFGYIGLFRAKGIGTFRSYVTDAKKVFLIYRTKGLPIAISVSEPDEFMPFYLKGGAK